MKTYAMFTNEGAELINEAVNMMHKAQRFDYGFKDIGDGVAEISWTSEDAVKRYKPLASVQMAYALEKLMMIETDDLYNMIVTLHSRFDILKAGMWIAELDDIITDVIRYKKSKKSLEYADALLFDVAEMLDDYDDLCIFNEAVDILFLIAEDAPRVTIELMRQGSVVHTWIKD